LSVCIVPERYRPDGFPIGIVIFPPILLALLVVCGMKGKWGIVGGVLVVTAVVALSTGFDSGALIGFMIGGVIVAGQGAARLARPGSYWARERYDAEKLRKAKAHHESGDNED
jgi:hypothetical protein